MKPSELLLASIKGRFMIEAEHVLLMCEFVLVALTGNPYYYSVATDTTAR